MRPLLRRLLRTADLVLFVLGLLYVALLVFSLTKAAFEMQTWQFRVLSLAMAVGFAFWAARVVIGVAQRRGR